MSVPVIMDANIQSPMSFYDYLRYPQAVLAVEFLPMFFQPLCHGYDFFTAWVLMALAPMCICTFVYLLGQLRALHPDKALRTTYMCVHVFYVYTLTRAWQLVDCVPVPSQGLVLSQAPSEQCWVHGSWAYTAALALLLAAGLTWYPIHLYRLIQRVDRRDQAVVKHWGFLYLAYADFFWWWEPVVEIGKKWALVSVATFVSKQGRGDGDGDGDGDDGAGGDGAGGGDDDGGGYGDGGGELLRVCCLSAVLLLAWSMHARHRPYRHDWAIMTELENGLQHMLYAIEVCFLVALYVHSRYDEGHEWSVRLRVYVLLPLYGAGALAALVYAVLYRRRTALTVSMWDEEMSFREGRSKDIKLQNLKLQGLS